MAKESGFDLEMGLQRVLKARVSQKERDLLKGVDLVTVSAKDPQREVGPQREMGLRMETHRQKGRGGGSSVGVGVGAFGVVWG